MDFYLIQKDDFNLTPGCKLEQNYTFAVKFPFINANPPGDQTLWEKFVQVTNAQFSDKDWMVTMTLVPPENPQASSDSITRGITLKGEIFQVLQQLLHDDNANEKLKIELKVELTQVVVDFTSPGSFEQHWTYFFSEALEGAGLGTPSKPPTKLIGEFTANAFCPDFDMDGLPNHGLYVQRAVNIPLRMLDYVPIPYSVKIKVSAEGFVYLGDILPRVADGNRQIFMERKLPDFTIFSEDGTPIPCHKVFLTKSPVLSAMLEGDYQEARNNEMTMSDMTTQGVDALLEYFYCDDVRKARTNCDIALELLKAADMYDLSVLWEAMSTVIGEKPHSWFRGDMALKVFDFVGKCNRTDSQKMMHKMLQVLSMKPEQL